MPQIDFKSPENHSSSHEIIYITFNKLLLNHHLPKSYSPARVGGFW